MRQSKFWGEFRFWWGISLGPYAAILAFAVLVAVWLVRKRIRAKHWSWYVSQVDKVDLSDGVSPIVLPHNQWQSAQKTAWLRLLNAL